MKPQFEKLIMDMFSGDNPNTTEKQQEISFASKDFMDTFFTEYSALKKSSNPTQYYQFDASISDHIKILKGH